ncbi:DUF1501 domain-containing protein [Asaia spathodeae]|uniref:DUF1501 domain-containing protein n=1 Tax=Asaia spathodeae TaxID=657016 RepID=A0ABX2P481_9PROT|nr:DUF1501 domain-containing protein [Asaia spathodeae]GBR17035.1 hypothetical protein AA105894_1717 [Asaia spathodeae NBRC 105894]
MRLSRRSALLGLTASWSLGRASLALAAPSSGAQDPRLVVILLRGALDGMAAVTPYGDSGLVALRRDLLLPEPGRDGGLLDLGGFFGLHPALAGLHQLYGQGQMLPVHAVAAPYRTRSHFDAQDYLESGASHRLDSGWLNRAVSALPGQSISSRVTRPDGFALALGLDVPLLLRGPASIGSYAPAGSQHPTADLYHAIAQLNAHDPQIGPGLRKGLQARGYSDDIAPTPFSGSERKIDAFTRLASAAGLMLARADGPRVAALELGGWDSHAGQIGALKAPLTRLDEGIDALKTSLGLAWSQSVVVAMTEFGRTARMNGTGGTDHGTGAVTFLAGGAVKGGRIVGTWPGLRPGQLFENRDLAPTTDLRSLIAGVLCTHLKMPRSALRKVFPDAPVEPLSGIVTGQA